MAKDATIFDKKSAERISKNVLWGEQQRQRGGDFHANEHVQPHETIYVQLIEKDPAGEIGYWSAQEVYYDDGRWELIDAERIWDGDAQPYVRHYCWGEAELNQIVKLMLVADIQTGVEEWVFDTDVTNPEAFVFYSDQNGNGGQALNDSSWTMRTAGKVLTNVGEADINAPFTIQPGQACQVVVTFIDYGNGFQLSSAVLTTGEGQYWSVGSDGSIIVQHRIAKAVIDGDVVRLEQYHAGDVHLEVFGVADEDTDDPTPTPSPIDIQGDEDWINVTRLGNLYTINHKPPPGAAHAMASMKGLSTDFSCDSVSWSTVADVQSWVNNELLANIREIFYDTRGHIYDLKDCAGASVTPTDDPTSVYLQSSMVADYFSGSDIGPDAVGAGGGIDFTYKILNDGANYLAYIGTKKVQVGLIMANGNPVQIATSGAVPVLFSMTKLAENVAGTSGLARVNPTELILGTERFQFNSTANLHVSIIGVGLIQSAAFNTSSCSATNNISGITNIRDYQDPNAAAMSLSVSYDVTFLGSATSPGFITATDNGPYISAVTISYADDTPVAWSTEGSGGPFKTETRFLELDNTSATGTFDKIWFKLRDADAAGDQIKICSKLLTFDRLTDANASSCDLYSISSDDDCITDEDGVRVTDDSGECITDGSLEELSLASCPSPGSGLINDNSITGEYTTGPAGDDWAQCNTRIGSSSGPSTTFTGAAELRRIPSETLLSRTASRFDFSGVTGDLMIRGDTSHTASSEPDQDVTWVALYKVASSLPAVTNPLYDMDSWTVIGTFKTLPLGNVSYSGEGIPLVNNVWIGVMSLNDYNNDYSEWSGLDFGVGGRITQAYECP